MSVLDRFEVVEVPRTFSIAEARILKNRVSFNLCTASELGYPLFVRIFISHDRSQIALQPCDKTTPNAMKFFTAEAARHRRKKAISVGNRALTTLIKSSMRWEMEKPAIVPGVRFAEENVIIFDLKQAHEKGKGCTSSTSLCTLPVPAAPFYQVSSAYFAEGEADMIQAEGRVVGEAV